MAAKPFFLPVPWIFLESSQLQTRETDWLKISSLEYSARFWTKHVIFLEILGSPRRICLRGLFPALKHQNRELPPWACCLFLLVLNLRFPQMISGPETAFNMKMACQKSRVSAAGGQFLKRRYFEERLSFSALLAAEIP